jgi:hypothetical protein
VLDGATDLHDAPLTAVASDASWIAHFANAWLHGATGQDLRAHTRAASIAAAQAFARLSGAKGCERWQSPISSLLMIAEDGDGVRGLDLGDSRMFALGADGAVHVAGGPEDAADSESKLAAQQTDADKPLLQRDATIARLRDMRAALNREGGSWTFCLDPACADHARVWRLELQRPAHVLLMTDGFSALVDRYRAFEAGGLVRAAIDRGLETLGSELRAIEHADSGGARHPRFKRSDDATAVLMRLS